MKKLILLIALTVGIATNSKAQAKPGDFKFDTETFDFGKIPMGNPVQHVFTFTNIGQQPIIISKIETTCGCAVPEYTQEPVVPNAQGVVKITFNPTAGPAPFNKAITINSNARTPVKMLIIKGETINPKSE